MGRFGQPRYKDPAGTPAPLRGIREVNEKNRHILLEAVFNGEFIPDHLLPVGIHRCGQEKWRAHLCTVGHKFSGPPRDNVRDACEDRRRFCEENGVNFVLYGKQTHAKGPIGSRQSIPSSFPRLSDYVSSITRGPTGGAGTNNNQMMLSGMMNNPSLRAFFDALEDARKLLKSKKDEEEGVASYLVTASHAELHKRILEDRIDGRSHVFVDIENKSKNFKKIKLPFRLCPIKVQLTRASLGDTGTGGGLLIRFLYGSAINDLSLKTYLESVLVNVKNPPLSGPCLSQLVDRLIKDQVKPQLLGFQNLNSRIRELNGQFGGNYYEAIKHVYQTTLNTMHTRKGASKPNIDEPMNLMVNIDLGTPSLRFNWNAMSPDSVAEDFALACHDEQDLITGPDILYTIIEQSCARRIALYGVSTKNTDVSINEGRIDEDNGDDTKSDDDEVIQNMIQCMKEF